MEKRCINYGRGGCVVTSLRSELNFPIGHKYPIDLSGYRWNLPIHLCDAVFTQKQENSLMHPTYKLLKACKLTTKRFLKG